MTAANVRARLVDALGLNLIGPEADERQIDEVLSAPPSRWYLTRGRLAP